MSEVRNIVIGCSDERLKEVSEKFVKDLNPYFERFKNGGLLNFLSNQSKMTTIRLFENIFKPKDEVRIWALLHEECQFLNKCKKFTKDVWLNKEALKNNLIPKDVRSFIYLSEHQKDNKYQKAVEGINGYIANPDKFSAIQNKYKASWNDKQKAMEEISSMLQKRLHNLFTKSSLEELQINPEINFIFQMKINDRWENFQSINQYQTVLELEKETIKV